MTFPNLMSLQAAQKRIGQIVCHPGSAIYYCITLGMLLDHCESVSISIQMKIPLSCGTIMRISKNKNQVFDINLADRGYSIIKQ